MIKNLRQYHVTKSQIQKLYESLTAAKNTGEKRNPLIQQAMVAGIESQLRELEREVRDFEALTEQTCLEGSTHDVG